MAAWGRDQCIRASQRYVCVWTLRDKSGLKPPLISPPENRRSPLGTTAPIMQCQMGSLDGGKKTSNHDMSFIGHKVHIQSSVGGFPANCVRCMKTTFLRGSITRTQFSLLLSDDEDEDVSRSPLARSLLMKTPRLTTPKFPWAKKSRPFARAELHYEASLCWKNKIFHLGRAIIHCIGCLYTHCAVYFGGMKILPIVNCFEKQQQQPSDGRPLLGRREIVVAPRCRCCCS